MKIGVDQFFHFSAGAALSARIGVRRLQTIHILGESDGQRKGSYTFLTQKEQGVRNFFGLYLAN